MPIIFCVMKALYSRKELRDNPFDGGKLQVPLQRYLHRFLNERSKIGRMKHHERDFLFEAMLCNMILEEEKHLICFIFQKQKNSSSTGLF